MKVKIVKNYEELSEAAAEIIIQKVVQSPKLNLGLATGGTPKGTYQKLIDDHQKNGTSYLMMITFNLDEYIGLSEKHPSSYRFYMDRFLFNHINIDQTNTFLPRGDVQDVEGECERYESLIEEKGGIDLQVLGIGKNGHIGFNEPGSSFVSKTHIVRLTPSTREANARYFETVEDVPTQAITMGISTIMKSKEILLLIAGKSKKAALHQLLNGKVNESFPASILNYHPNVTIIADEAAASNDA